MSNELYVYISRWYMWSNNFSAKRASNTGSIDTFNVFLPQSIDYKDLCPDTLLSFY